MKFPLLFILVTLIATARTYADDPSPAALAWAKSLTLGDLETKKAAELYAHYSTVSNGITYVQYILSNNSQIFGGDSKDLDAVLSDLKDKESNDATVSINYLTKKYQDSQTLRVAYQSASNSFRDPNILRGVASVLSQYPSDQISYVERVIANRAAILGIDHSSDILANLKKNLPPNSDSKELATNVQAELRKSTNAVQIFQWSRNTLRANGDVALQLANFSELYPDNEAQYLQQIVADHLYVFGTDKLKVDELLASIQKNIPPESKPDELQKKIINLYNQNRVLKSTYDWSRTSMYDDIESRSIAKFAANYPSNQQSYLQAIVVAQTHVLGNNAPTIDKILGSITHEVPPSEDTSTNQDALTKLYTSSTTLSSAYDWAKSTLGLSDDLAHKIALVIQKQPAAQISVVEQKILSEISNPTTKGESLDQILFKFSMYYDWGVSKQNSPISCEEKNLIDPNYKQKISINACLENLKVKYHWTNEAKNVCAVYTDETDHIIEPTNPANCSNPIVRDLRSCVKTLDRAYHFYHYTTIDKIGRTPGENSDSAIQNHAYVWASHALEPHGYGNSGLYTAIDPIATQDYGARSSDGVRYLYRIEIPKGSTYAEFSGQRGQAMGCNFSPESIAKLQEAGCATNPGQFLGNEAAGPAPTCAPLVKEVFKALHFRGWSYPYSYTGFYECKSRPPDAFVWEDLDGLPKQNVELFRSNVVPAAGTPEHTEAVEIQQIMQSKGASFYPQLNDEAKKGRPLDTILGENLIGCENLAPAVATRSQEKATPCEHTAVDFGLMPVQNQVNDLYLDMIKVSAFSADANTAKSPAAVTPTRRRPATSSAARPTPRRTQPPNPGE